MGNTLPEPVKEKHGEEATAQRKKKHDPLSKRKHQITYLARLVGLERAFASPYNTLRRRKNARIRLGMTGRRINLQSDRRKPSTAGDWQGVQDARLFSLYVSTLLVKLSAFVSPLFIRRCGQCHSCLELYGCSFWNANENCTIGIPNVAMLYFDKSVPLSRIDKAQKGVLMAFTAFAFNMRFCL